MKQFAVFVLIIFLKSCAVPLAFSLTGPCVIGHEDQDLTSPTDFGGEWDWLLGTRREVVRICECGKIKFFWFLPSEIFGT